jgi:hypothetical protein
MNSRTHGWSIFALVIGSSLLLGPQIWAATIPTPTPEISIAWHDDFTGMPGVQPPEWQDEDDNNTYNARAVYSASGTYVNISVAVNEIEGYILSEPIRVNINLHTTIEVKINGSSPSQKWNLHVRKYGETNKLKLYDDILAIPDTYTKTTLGSSYIAEYEASANGMETLQVELWSKGAAGTYISVDSIRIYGNGQVPQSTGLNIHRYEKANQSDIVAFQNQPVVAWSEGNYANYRSINIKKYDGTRWQLLYEGDKGRFGDPHLATDDESIYLAYAQYIAGTQPQIHIKKFNGRWFSLGNSWTAENEPDIAVINKTPYVSWAKWDEAKSVHYVYVNRWNGVSWEAVGDVVNANTTTCIEYPHPKITGYQNTPYIAWFDKWEFYRKNEYQSAHAQLKMFNGTHWQQLGSTVSRAREPEVAITSTGIPYVIWRLYNAQNWQVFLRYWDYISTELEQFSIELNMDAERKAFTPDITIVDETPFIVWQEQIAGEHYEVFAKFRDGAQWKDLENGNIAYDPANRYTAYNPHLASSNNKVFISWSEYDECGIGQLYWKEYSVAPQSTPTPYVAKVKTYTWPNPFLPVLGQITTFNFDNTQGHEFEIKILNVRGRIVRTLINTKEWDGRNEQGNLCEGGLYIYQIHTQGKRRSGTIVVLK